jgi:hypothetical protein
MYPYLTLSSINKLQGTKVLDIGSRDCKTIIPFLKNNFSVDALDKDDYKKECEGIGASFIQANILDFKTDTKYDIVIARHIVPFLNQSIQDSIKTLFSFKNSTGVVFVTLFGEDDEWNSNDRVTIISSKEALAVCNDLKVKVLYQSEEKYNGKLYSGEGKFWHVITLVLS